MNFFKKKKPDNQPINIDYLIKILEKILEIENVGYCFKSSKTKDLILNQSLKNLLLIKNNKSYQNLEDILKNLNETTINQLFEALEDKNITNKTFIGKITTPEAKEIKLNLIKKPFENIDFLIIVTDISLQEKEKKELIKKLEKLEENNKLKNIFLANISKEFRTPLNSIIGFTELLNLFNCAEQDRENYLKIIKNQSNYLLQIFDDISEIALFESGNIKPTNSPCNLNLLLKELYILFNQQKKFINKENIEIRMYLPDNKGINIYTDSGRLHQLLSNLINNSLKNTEKGFIEFGYNMQENNKILFFIRNTGKPLSKNEIKNINEKFKSKEIILINSKDEKVDLALSLSKQIVNLLKGKLWIESDEKTGNTFYLLLPFNEIPQNFTTNDNINIDFKEQIFNIIKDKIFLIVEDDDVSYIFLESLLIDKYAKVIRAKNGIEAIELLKKLPKIDIILMDIRMPELDGIEASKKIKELKPEIKILAQTAYAATENLNLYSSDFFDDIITKPINISELFKKIIKLLS